MVFSLHHRGEASDLLTCRHSRFRPCPSLHTSGVGGNQRKLLRRGPACERRVAPSMRFVIPRATSSDGVRSTRGYHTRHLPPLGFLNPSTACASADLPVLFHTGATCGIQRTRTIARIASWYDAVDDPAESRWTSQPHSTDQNAPSVKPSSRRRQARGREHRSEDPTSTTRTRAHTPIPRKTRPESHAHRPTPAAHRRETKHPENATRPAHEP